MAKGFFRNLLDILFPPKCVFCRKVLKPKEKDICVKCLKELPYIAPGEEEISGEHFERCVAALYYRGTVPESMHRFKFKGYNGYASCYGALVADCVNENLKGQYDIITWVPLSPERKKERGYDQAMLLAMAAANELDDVAIETLIKSTDTLAQSGLHETELRRANVVGAYEAVDTELISGKRLLLIDDVVTSGSTLSECAKVLKNSGAVQVLCATLTYAKRGS